MLAQKNNSGSPTKSNASTPKGQTLPRIKSKSILNSSNLSKLTVTPPKITKIQNLHIQIPASPLQAKNIPDEIPPQNHLPSTDSPVEFQSHFNPRTKTQKLPPMLNLQGVSKFAPKLAIQDPTGKSPLLIESPTLLTHKRRSIRKDLTQLQRFDFSKPKEPGFSYDSPGLRAGKSPTLSSAHKLSPALEVCGKNIESPLRRQSGLFHHRRLKNSHSTIELKETPKSKAINISTNNPRRSSGILTRELEEKYGIKLTNTEDTVYSDESPTTGQQVPNSGTECSPKSPEKQSPKKLTELEESSSDDTSTTNDQNEKETKDQISLLPLDKMSQESPENKTFAAKRDDFFESADSDQLYNDAFNRIRSRGHGLRSSTLDPNPQPFEEISIKRKEKPIIAVFSSSPQTKIVQPAFMKRTGSMCFTEFWSQKNSKKFMKLVQNNVKSVKIFGNKRQNECVYRPDKWKEEEKIKAKIQINRQEPHNPLSMTDVRSPKSVKNSLLKSESVKIFSPITPRTPNSNAGYSLPGSGVRTNPLRSPQSRTEIKRKTSSFFEYSRSSRMIEKANQA